MDWRQVTVRWELILAVQIGSSHRVPDKPEFSTAEREKLWEQNQDAVYAEKPAGWARLLQDVQQEGCVSEQTIPDWTASPLSCQLPRLT